jgi:AraC-like DNA-binding protein
MSAVGMRELASMIGDLDATMTRPLPTDTEAVRLLASHADLIRQMMVQAKPEVRQRVVTHVRNLMALALSPARQGTEVAKGHCLRAARLHAIKADIIANLGYADLSIVDVAARHRITPRYVQTLFEEQGSTFTEFVLAERLARAYQILSNPHFADRSITAVAFEVGFGDLSYFNRTFRRRFGCAPSRLRVAAHALAAV